MQLASPGVMLRLLIGFVVVPASAETATLQSNMVDWLKTAKPLPVTAAFDIVCADAAVAIAIEMAEPIKIFVRPFIKTSFSKKQKF